MEDKRRQLVLRLALAGVIIAALVVAYIRTSGTRLNSLLTGDPESSNQEQRGAAHNETQGQNRGNNQGDVPGTPMVNSEQHMEDMASEPGGEVGPHDLVTFATRDFSGSGNCGWCHTDLTDNAAADISIDSHWRSTMMANSGKDPYWQAKVSIETARLPDMQDEIEGICAGCHTPMAHEQSLVDGEVPVLQGAGFLNSGNLLHDAAMDGVSCTLCHQIQETGLGEASSFSGGYIIDTSTSATNRIAFGPYPNPFGNPMKMHTGFTPAYALHVNEAKLCATCHTLFTPYVDASGEIAGTFPEQTPYLEWLHSSYAGEASSAKSCQSCHMPQASGAVVIANRPRGGQLEPREPFYQHHFVGGNVTMLNLYAAERETLGITADAEHIASTLQRTQDQLSMHSAQVTVDTVAVDGQALTVAITTQVYTGHKLPTGFPARRAWLYMTVTDASGLEVFSSGAPLPDGRISGCDADEDVATYEPHYDVITAPDQVQIYESIMQNSGGGVTYTLLRASGYIKDNRLLPVGFDAETAGADFAVYGVSGDADFQGGGDTVHYVVDTGSATGPFTVKAVLLYQSISYQTQQDLLVDATPESEAFVAMLRAMESTPVALAAAEAVSE